MALVGKTGLIFGFASQRSIAWGIAQAWNREGAQLCISIQKDRFRSTIESLTSNWTRKPLIVTADVNQDEGLDSAFETIGREFDNIDCMSHSIAYATQSGMKNSILDCTREDFSIAHETSAYSLIALAKRVVPHMHSGGSIISLSYIGSQRAASTYRVMGPAKASLEATSRYLAQELGPKNIRVNVISAGPINTLAARGIVGFTDMMGESIEKSPLKKAITLEEVGDTATFLVSSASSAITGQVIYVDGGFSSVI